MNFEIKISKNHTELPLGKILGIIDGEKYRWRIKWLQAVGRLSGGWNMMDLERQVKSVPDGLQVEWNQLKDLANHMDDVHEIFIAATQVARSNEHTAGSGEPENIALTIELFDSNHWFLQTVDRSIATQLQALEETQ